MKQLLITVLLFFSLGTSNEGDIVRVKAYYETYGGYRTTLMKIDIEEASFSYTQETKYDIRVVQYESEYFGWVESDAKAHYSYDTDFDYYVFVGGTMYYFNLPQGY